MAEGRLIDLKSIGRPRSFDGSDQSWSEWSFVFRSYCSLVSPSLSDLMERAQEAPMEVPMSENVEEATMQRELFHMLVMLCQGRALTELQRSPSQNGLEAWRRLCAKYEPLERGRALGLLTGCLNPVFGADLIESLNSWEQLVKRYEDASGEGLPSGIRIATILKALPQPLRGHMQLQSRSFATYNDLRLAIEAYCRTQVAWSSSGNPVSMEIDAVWAPKSSGKGSKGKSSFSSGAHDQGSKGKGKTSGKGKSKDGKASGKGSKSSSGKSDRIVPGTDGSTSQATCHKCHQKGHIQRVCPMKHVQFVEGEDSGEQNAVSMVESSWILMLESVYPPPSDVICAVAQQSEAILIDSGAQVHVCSRRFWMKSGAELQQSPLNLRDVQGNTLKHIGRAAIPLIFGPSKQPAVVTFEVADIPHTVMSVGLMVEKGVLLSFGPTGTYLSFQGVRVDLEVRNRVAYLMAEISPVRHRAIENLLVCPVEGAAAAADVGEDVAHEAMHVDEGRDRPVGDPKAVAKPVGPSAEERAKHMLSHIPAQPWCEFCLSGRGKDAAHRVESTDERTQNLIQLDYAFVSEEVVVCDEEAISKRTLLIGVDTDTGAPLASVVTKKGPEPFVVALVCRFIKSLGVGNIVLASDGENAIGSLIAAVAKQLKSDGIKTVVRSAPRGSPQSNGGAERMVQTIMGLVRTITFSFESRASLKVPVASTLFPWIVRHSAWLWHRFAPHGPAKQSSYFRVHGGNYHGAIAEIFEVVMAREPFTRSKMDPRFVRSMWLGKSELSDEHLVMDANGDVWSTRAVRRRPNSDDIDLNLLRALDSVPWELKGQGLTRTGQLADRAPGAELLFEPFQVAGPVPPPRQPEGPPVEVPLPGPSAAAASAPAEGPSDPPVASRNESTSKPSVPEDHSSPAENVGQSRGARSRSPAPSLPQAARGSGSSQPVLQASRGSSGGLPVLRSRPLEAPLDTVGSPPEVRRADNSGEERDVRRRLLAVEAESLQEMTEDMIYEGRCRELDRMDEFGVYEWVERSAYPDAPCFGSTWVDRLKSDEVKSRLCCQDIAWFKSEEFFAATPLTLAGKVIELLAVKRGWSVLTADVSVAFLHAPAEDEVLLRPPKEATPPEGMQKPVWLLRKQLYGRRGAPKAWQEFLQDQLAALGLKTNVANPTMHFDPVREVYLDVHVDDFLATGPEGPLSWIFEQLQNVLLIKIAPLHGIGDEYEHLRAWRKRTPDGLYIVSSQSYLDDVLELLDMKQCSGVATPAVPDKVVEDDQPLSAEMSSTYRCCVGKLLYMCQCRYDASWAIRHCCKFVKEPTTSALVKLKRLARYLHQTRNLSWFLPAAGEMTEIEAVVDSDWASCPRTRKSVSSGFLRMGGAVLHHWTRSQSVPAQSSAEAELYALVEGANEAMGLHLVFESMNMHYPIVIYSDSSAGRQAARRVGPGSKLRHVALRHWVIQDYVRSGKVTIKPVPGEQNPADIGTKAVARATLERLRPSAGIVELPKTSEAQQSEKIVNSVELETAQRVLTALTVLTQLFTARAEPEFTSDDDDSGFWKIVVVWSAFMMCLGAIVGMKLSRSGRDTRQMATVSAQTLEALSVTSPLEHKVFTSTVEGECYHMSKKCFGLSKARQVTEWRPCKICSAKPKKL